MPTETASMRPSTQFGTPNPQRSPFAFPAAQTRIVFSAAPAWARRSRSPAGEVRPEVFFGVLADEPLEAEAEIQDVKLVTFVPPGKRGFEDLHRKPGSSISANSSSVIGS